MFVILPFCTGSQLIEHHNSNSHTHILPLRQHIAAALLCTCYMQYYNLLHVHVHVDTITVHHFKCCAHMHLKSINKLQIKVGLQYSMISGFGLPSLGSHHLGLFLHSFTNQITLFEQELALLPSSNLRRIWLPTKQVRSSSYLKCKLHVYR